MKKDQRTWAMYVFLFATLLFCNHIHAQNWLVTGNTGITNSNFLGTTDSKNLIFKVKNIERGRLAASTGQWRFGNATNNAKFDSGGRLSFGGTGDYLVADNRYVFRASGNSNLGLFYNATTGLYEFRDGTASPVFTVDAITGAGEFKSSLRIGNYILPSTDGTNGQVLKTNGAGILSFADESSGGSGWSLTGNANTSSLTNFVGTTDAHDLVFRTNNVEAIRILSSGRKVGIGTSSPLAKLHINSASDEDGLRVQINSLTKLLVHKNGGVAVGGLFTPPDNGLFVDSMVGIGTANPRAKLHILRGAEASLTSNGFLILGDTSSLNLVMDNNEMQVRNNGTSDILFLNPAGGLVKTGSDLDVDGNAINLGSVEQISDGGGNLISTNSSFIPLSDNQRSLGNSTNRWLDVWAVDGTINTSDLRDKQNIRDLSYGLDDVMKLRPVKFNWKTGDNKNDKLGLIAQELQKVIPEVVRDYEFKTDEASGKNKKVASERLGVMYADLIPVLIHAIQQQQKEIDELNALIKGQSAMSQNTNATSVVLSNASLEQNIPNPLSNSATIRYSVPANAREAHLIITDVAGKTIKQIELSKASAGIININVSGLRAGTYNYSLIVDGKVVDTKRMIISR